MGGRAVAAASLSVIAAWVALWSARDTVGAAAWVPGPQRVEASRAELMTALGTTARSAKPDLDALETQAKALAAKAPLDAAPFVVAGAIADQRGDMAGGLKLHQAGLARDPRSAAAHFMLAQHALAANQPEAALDHLASIARLQTAAGSPFGKAVLDFARDPANTPVLKRFLARNPDNRDVLFQQMATDTSLAGRLVEFADLRRPGDAVPPWLGGLTQRLLEQGQGAQALALWTRFGAQPDPRSAAVRDPDFHAAAIPAPFGWTIETPEGGAAARSEHGLDVEAYGRVPGRLAWQWLLLRPGRYRLNAVASGQALSLVEWRIACAAPKGPVIAAAPANRPLTFEVPAGCGAQALELWLRNAEEDTTAEGRIASVAIEAVR